MADAAENDSPFFMYLAFNAPHDPRRSPAEYVGRYPADSILIPDNFKPHYPYASEIGCGDRLRDEHIAAFPRTQKAIQVHRQEYYAIITHMDEMIGRILKALEASGNAENTWIFFTADHDLAVGQHGLQRKQNMYDHSVRVPFIVVGPGVDAAKKIAEPIYLQDVMPTTLGIAGVKHPEHVEFNSLFPLLDGATSPYNSIYGCYLSKQRSIRTDRYKLLAYPDAKVLRLYDLQRDPTERHDLAQQAKMKPVVASLFRSLIALQRKMNDDLELSALARQ